LSYRRRIMGGELQEELKMVRELQEKCRKWEVSYRRSARYYPDVW
jgi:hypothetical protein